jgi:AcrR family transcriptional regulator
VDPERILDAAQKVFAQGGLTGSSIRAIAKEVGCDPSLIYYHFESKETMFLALMDRKFPILVAEIQRLSDPADQRHTAERLWNVLHVYRRLFAEDAGFRSIIRGEIAQGTEGIRDAMAQRIRPVLMGLADLIRQGIERGHVRPSLPPTLGTLFLVRPYIDFLDVVPLMSQRVFGLPPTQALAAVEQAWFQLYWRGIASDPHAPLPFLNSLQEPRS